MFLLLPGGGLCNWKLELADCNDCAELPKKPKVANTKTKIKGEEKQINKNSDGKIKGYSKTFFINYKIVQASKRS